MSRVGKSPIHFGKEVQVSVGNGNVVTVKGAKSSLAIPMDPKITAKIENGMLTLARKSDDKSVSAMHGMYRALINNAVVGVTKGFTKTLEINGVGFKANVNGRKLELILGYTHDILFDIPNGIDIKVDKNTKVIITGADRGLVGQVAAKIRAFREPEPYKGKGIKYDTETIRRKAGKSVTK